MIDTMKKPDYPGFWGGIFCLKQVFFTVKLTIFLVVSFFGEGFCSSERGGDEEIFQPPGGVTLAVQFAPQDNTPRRSTCGMTETKASNYAKSPRHDSLLIRTVERQKNGDFHVTRKRSQRPFWMLDWMWNLVPKTMTLRLVRVRIDVPGMSLRGFLT